MIFMDLKKKKIAVITPVKNEINNLPGLIESIENQTYSIYLWIIINDKSSDGSEEYLKKKKNDIKNVEKIEILNIENLPDNYQLGIKYSGIISYGFDYFNKYKQKNNIEFDFIGILDADIKIDINYYKNLIEKFEILPKLGIASGVLFYYKNNKLKEEKMPKRWARGNSRLWRIKCFNTAGYKIGKSADSISSALAWINGWQTQSFSDSFGINREVGERVEKSYYGEAAYYLHIPIYYLILKFFYLIIKGKIKYALSYINGYYKGMKAKNKGNFEKKLILYYKFLPFRCFIEAIIVIMNILIVNFYKLKKLKFNKLKF